MPEGSRYVGWFWIHLSRRQYMAMTGLLTNHRRVAV